MIRVGIVGAASRTARHFATGIEPVVREVVRQSLDDAVLSLADIDMVVTVASDVLDGMMVPIRAELAGAAGKGYVNVPSAAGHAVAAAAAAIEAGDAASVLVVGWGAASRLAERDGRSNEFDPFFMRPVGATPRTVAALQKQLLVASSLTSEQDVAAFEARMRTIVWGSGAFDTAPTGGFCDGAAAIVLKRASDDDPAMILADHATASRSHAPMDGLLDPANWVRESVSRFGVARRNPPTTRGFIEASGTTSCVELRAIAALAEAGMSDIGAETANRKGGGAAAWFGPATGLRGLAELCRDTSWDASVDGNHAGVFVDLAGPIGQLVTSILIERRRTA